MAMPGPTDSKYMGQIQLRSCDLTGGVSAFLQLQNTGEMYLKVSYRVNTGDKWPKEGDLLLLPGEIKRGAICQQCSRRNGGIESWEIISLEELPAPQTPSTDTLETAVQETKVAPETSPSSETRPLKTGSSTIESSTKKAPQDATLLHSSEPAKRGTMQPADISSPGTEKNPGVADEKSNSSAPIMPIQKPEATGKTPVASQPVAEQVPSQSGAAPKSPESIKSTTKDNKETPWDELPPEFRPRK